MNSEGAVEHSAELTVIMPAKRTSSTSSSSSSSSPIPYSPSPLLSSSFSSLENLSCQDDIVSECFKPGEPVFLNFEFFAPVSQKDLNNAIQEDASIDWYKSPLEENANQDLKEAEPISSDNNCTIKCFSPTEDREKIASSILVLHSLSQEQSGIYLCKCVVRGLKATKKYRVVIADDTIVHKKTRCLPPRFVKISRNQTVSEGSDAVLKCTVVGKPAPLIYWYMYGTKLYQGERHRFAREGTDGTLSVLATRWYDSAKYECKAVSPLGTATCCVDLCVQPADHQEVEFEGAPMFLMRTESKIVQVGSNVTFNCTVAGTPNPKVDWKKGDHVISARESSRYILTQSQGGAYSLTIKKVRLIDDGKYTCVAENARGVALCGTFLMVERGDESQPFCSYDVLPLAPVFVTRPYSATVRCGYSAAFQCTVHGVPQPKLTWHLCNGARIKTNGHYMVEDLKSHHTLRIPKTKQTDQGFYFCTASNSAGEVSCSVKLDVTVHENSIPPSVKFGAEALSPTTSETAEENIPASFPKKSSGSSKSIILTSGKNAKISLTVRGVPKPEVTWYKGGQQLRTGNRFSLYKNVDVYQLRIAKVQKDDAGLYSVLACNAGGLFTTLIDITVREIRLPSIFAKPPEPSISAHEGADAVIQCRLKENEKAREAKWWKENKLLQKTSDKYEMTSDGSLRQLTVKSVTANDSGEYKCQVGNHVEKAKLAVHKNQPGTQQDRNELHPIQEKTPIKILSLPTPAHMEVPEKGTLILQHRINEAVENCTWSLNGKQLYDSERCKITVKEGKYSLMLMNVSPKDAGDVVFKVPGSNVAITTSIKVQALPAMPKVPRVQMKDDTSVRVSWQPTASDDVEYVIEAFSDKSKEWKEVGVASAKAGQFTVTGLEPGTSYTFRMKAQNQAGMGVSCDSSQQIMIPSKTYIVQGLDDIAIMESETARFNVQLSSAACGGNWFLNGLKLSQRGETCQLMTSGCAHSLVMRNLTKTGSATVQFVTSDGKLMTSAQLMVKGKSLSVVQKLADVTVTENADATFTVALSKAVNKLAKWYHKGLELTQSHDVIMEKRGEFQVLHMKNIKNTASGEIRFVMLGEPQTSCSAKLTVLGWFETEPFQKISTGLPESTSIQIGGDTVFTIRLSSDGKCNSSWSHCGKPIPRKSKKYKIKQHGDEIRLTIRDVTVDDVGPVQCLVDKQKTVTELKVDQQQLEVADGKMPNSEPPKPLFTFVDDESESSRSQVRSFSEGERDVTITCRVSDPNAKVEWRKNGKAINMEDENVKVIDENNERKLIFRKVSPIDSATYDCVLISDSDDLMKKSFEIHVKETLQLITKQLCGKQDLTEGDIMRLTVFVEPPTTDLVWMKDGLKLKVSEDKDSRIQATGIGSNERHLVVKEVTCQDSGVYSCETLHDSSKLSIKVSEPVVEVIQNLNNCECEDCGTVSFQVKLSRKPKVSHQWKLNGRKLVNNDDCLITCNENLHCATLRNLTSKDSGQMEFVCGEVKETASLLVQPPPIKFTQRLNDVTASAGFEAIFLCEVNDDDAEVQWFKDGVEIRSNDRYVIIREGRVRKLKFKEATFEESGSSFKCKSKNDVTTCTLQVEKPVLSVVEELSDVTVIEGERAIFRCKLSLADVKVIWLKNGKILEDEKHKREVISDGYLHELRMRKLTTADSGEVKLVVDCDLLDCATLLVKKPPVRFTRDLRDQVVDLKVQVEMMCEVSDHEAEVTWYRNDVTVEEAQKSTDLNITTHTDGCKRFLVISRALMHHEARYSCVTEDGNRTSAELFIKVPPLTLVRPLSDVSKYIGDDVEFMVELSMADIEGEWLLDSEPISVGKKVKTEIKAERKTLILKDVRQPGIITYRVNKQVTTTCRLDVRERPVAIERRLSDVRAREGSDVAFECYFSKPDLQVTWYMDDEELTSDAKFCIDTDGCTQRLRVSDVRYDDEANYSCRYKHRRTSAELTVLEPRIDLIKPLRDFDVYEGDCCVLECKLSLPEVPVSWNQDGRPTMGAESQVVKGNESVTHILTLENLTRSSSGSYSLVCLNKTLTTCKIQVSPKPIAVLTPLYDLTIQDDQELVLECEFSKPCSNVMWTHDGREIKKSSRILFNGQTTTVHRLEIKSPEWNDSGRYCCVVPKHCETSCRVIVEQWRIALVQNLPQSLVLSEGDEGQLTVKFSTHVQPDEVTWFVDDVKVDDVFAAENMTSVRHSHCASNLVIEKAHLRWKDAAVSVTCRNLAASCIIDVIGLPSAPQCIGVTQDGLHVKLAWKEPSDLGGCDVIDYVIEVKAVDEWKVTDCFVTMPRNHGDLIQGLVKGLTAGITYCCRVAAVTEHGTGEFSEFEETFTPEEPLIFSNELEDLVVEEGESLEMWCELSRPSKIEAVWTRDDVIIGNDDDRVSFYSYDDTREIVIEPVSCKDNGMYKCSVGNITSSCHVTVNSLPTLFLRQLNDVIVAQGNELELTCALSATCDDVKWLKDGDILHTSPRHQMLQENTVYMLVVEEVNRTDAGTYTCQATDYNGVTISTESTVHVLTSEEETDPGNGLKTQQTIEDDVFESDSFESDSLDDELLNAETSSSSDESITKEEEMTLENEDDLLIVDAQNYVENQDSIEREDLKKESAYHSQNEEETLNGSEFPVLKNEENIDLEVQDLAVDDLSEKNGLNDGLSSSISKQDSNVSVGESQSSAADVTYTPERADYDKEETKEENVFVSDEQEKIVDSTNSSEKETCVNMATIESPVVVDQNQSTDESCDDVSGIDEMATSRLDESSGSDAMVVSDGNVGKTVSFGDLKLTEKVEQSESDEKKRKRMSVASVFSDAYETANESFVTDDDAFTDATEGEDPDESHVVSQNEETNVKNIEVESENLTEAYDPSEDEGDSACTVSSFNSVEIKALSPVLEVEEDDCNNLVMDLSQLREAFLSDALPTSSRATEGENIKCLTSSGRKEISGNSSIMDLVSCVETEDFSQQEKSAASIELVCSENKEAFSIDDDVVPPEKKNSSSEKYEIFSEKDVSLADDATPPQGSIGGSQGLVDCLHHAYDTTCIIQDISPPVEETKTTIVVDAKTGETVTMSSKKMEIITTSFNAEESRDALEQIKLPQETTDDKLARMFGSLSSVEEGEEAVTKVDDGEEFQEVFETEIVPTAATEEQVIVFETVTTVTSYDDIIESCVQALETIHETSTVALCSDSDEEHEIHTRQGNFSNQPTTRDGLSPGFKEGLHNQQVYAGSTVYLQCVVAASPAPCVVWSKEGNSEDVMRLDDSMPGINMTFLHMSENLTQCTLVLDNVTLLDSGLYSCQASNSHGQSSCSAVVQVHDESDDVVFTSDNVTNDQISDDVISGDVTPTGVLGDVYTSDDDVSISMPPPSERSCSFQAHFCKLDETKSIYSERGVQAVVDNADKMSMASASTKPLKIHVLESIVVRETFESTESCSCTDSESDSSSNSPVRRRQKTSAPQYHEVAVKRFSRPVTSCLSDSESDDESYRSSVVKTPEVYYAVRGYGASGRDSATLQLTSGQAVEVMDVSCSKEWLVRTKPNKHNPVRMGFVDPAFLAPHHFTPSPAPPRVLEESFPSATRTTEFLTGRETSGLVEDKFQFPNYVDEFDHVIASEDELMSACSNPSKRNHVVNLIQEEKHFIVCLRKAIHVIKTCPIISAPVESHAQQLFGDLEGLEHFHTTEILPDLASIQTQPHLLPHVFLKHHETFEQLHLSYVMNTSDASSLVQDDETIADGLSELSLQTGVSMMEIPQTTLQHLVLYQYYLKKLLHYEDTPQTIVRPIRDAVQLLSDIPNKARTTKLWSQMRGRPKQSDLLGKLIKEGVVGTSNPDDVRKSGRWRFRRVLLFENCLVIAKLHSVTSRSYSDGSDFEQILQTDSMIIESDDTNLQSRVMILTSTESGLGVALWRLALKTKTEASKKLWIRQLQKAIHYTIRPSLSASPRFSLPISDVTVNEGGDVTLFCYVTNKPDTGVVWSKGGKEKYEDPSNRCNYILIAGDQVVKETDICVKSVERDDGYCALYLRHVTVDDAGVYRCMTASGGLSEISSCAEVTVTTME
uniref:Obscurin n=1 Tax=Phallusia mammillata TaxID=59560 RepID=A0A6F9DM88_9ASCI|nr:obscurin [Phallusia mammillata]